MTRQERERTMEFLLAQRAKADGQMESIRRIVRTGMKMLVRLEDSQKELGANQARLEENLVRLSDSQVQLGEKVNILIDAQIRTEQHLAVQAERLDTLTARVDKLSVTVDNLGVTVGKLGARVDKLAVKVDGLADAQIATDRSLRAFIDSLRKGTNGRKKG